MKQKKQRILIFGGSGFLGGKLYKELQAFFNVHATYATATKKLSQNQRFHHWDATEESAQILLENLRPDIIISAFKSPTDDYLAAHFEMIEYANQFDKKILFISSSNVFDAFTNFPSYEYDKTLSTSIYGKFQIKIENALMRMPLHRYAILRLPMVFGYQSPRLKELQFLYELDSPIEVFPNVVINATSHQKLTQQVHFIINQHYAGIFHLGSNDLVHHSELIEKICSDLNYENVVYKRIYHSNNDRFIAVLPKQNKLPKNYQISIDEVINNSIKVC
ncbi:MAG: sugar nucleotide-binding protein [Bacteroidota bacterium]